MGVFKDIGRLMKAGAASSARIDYAEALRQSADLAEQYANADPNAPQGTHGAASANPFANMAAYATMTPAAGTVLSLAPTGADVAGTPIYAVELDVLIDGRPPYRTTYQTVIAAGALHNWQPGKVLPFRVSPNDPHALMLG
ncbi:MAG: hypothetical protein J7484_08335 [Microbacterium sp.]|nr:hypothetical protein [Microbacterium sp.]